MKLIFITIIILISLSFYIGYGMFTLYYEMASIIANPICPEVYCQVCPEIVTSSKDDVFSYQNCEYERMCEFGGYCEACPKSWKEEYDLCRELRELEENN